MKLVIFTVLLFGVLGLYPPVELTRYITAWRNTYGELPVGVSFFGKGFNGELTTIWFSYVGSLVLLFYLLWRVKRGQNTSR